MLTLLTPSALWLLLSLPVIVLLYIVRERKRKREVSALFLWNEAQLLARRRRRISPTLLLLLQLLFAALLALALAQPRLNVAGAPPRVFVIDASASMAAQEAQGTRLEQAVAQAEASLADAGEVAVVRAGLGARVVQPPTGDHAAVRAALAELRAADAEAGLEEALELAHSLSPGAEIHLFSDQAKPVGFTEVTVHPVGEAVVNVGITAFELAYGQLFVSALSTAPYPQEVALVVTRGEDEVRSTLLLPARGEANLSLPVASETGLYRARLEGQREDALSLDDEAFVGSRALSVGLRGAAPALERALRAQPDVALSQAANTDVTVVVATTGEEAPLPPGDVVLFAAPQGTPRFVEVADWSRSDPLLRFVDLSGVVVAPAAALPLPLERAEVLAQSADLEPVLLRWEEGGRSVVYFAFHPSQSDLTRRPAFPILLTNLLESFRAEARLPLGSALAEGAWLYDPGRTELPSGSVTSAPLPATEARLEVSASASAAAAPAVGSSQAVRDPALWLVFGALVLLLAEWLFWSRGRLGPALTRPQRSPSARR